MAKINIIAGDLKVGKWLFFGEVLSEDKLISPERINLKTHLRAAESIDEIKKKTLMGTAAAGIAGAVLLGPLGAIGGMLVGGNKKDITFAAELSDGRKFLATTDSKTYNKLLAIAFDYGRDAAPAETETPKRDKNTPPPPWF